MTTREESLRALIDAQFAVDDAEEGLRVATIASMLMVPGEISADDLESWRSSQVARPKRILDAAITIRDTRLANAGMTLEFWAPYWEQAKRESQKTSA